MAYVELKYGPEDHVFEEHHPLIQHKITMIRDKETGTNEFRKCIEEIAMLMGYDALRDLPLEDVEVETPIEKTMSPMIAGKKLAIVPILRAGLGMVSGITALVPSAKIGHIGLYRDETTHEPHEYYCKLPTPIELRTIIVLDPMLATADPRFPPLTLSSSTAANTSSSSASSRLLRGSTACTRRIRTLRSISATSTAN